MNSANSKEDKEFNKWFFQVMNLFDVFSLRPILPPLSVRSVWGLSYESKSFPSYSSIFKKDSEVSCDNCEIKEGDKVWVWNNSGEFTTHPRKAIFIARTGFGFLCVKKLKVVERDDTFKVTCWDNIMKRD